MLIRQGKPRVINDLPDYLAKKPSSESTRLIVKEGMRSSLTLPLLVQGNPSGVMFFSSREAGAYREKHEEFLRSIVGHVAIAVERVRLIDAFRRQHEELVRSQSLAVIGELAATVAHEIKNPLAGMSGAIQILRDGMPPDDERREIIGEVLAQIGRLDNTVRDLLMFARPATPSRQEVSLRESIASAWSLLSQQPGVDHVRFHMNGMDGVVLNADAALLHQVWLNLLQNAVEAMPEGGDLRVRVTQGERVRIEVRDTGMGMDSASLAKVFRPFFSTKTRGTGLGLAISRKIVEAHGGTIRLESAPRRGTTVVVEIPP
jgi:signal transduction histidine kinase